jgi:hypothetical protein
VVHEDRRFHEGRRIDPGRAPPAQSCISDESMKMVDSDPKLKAFVNRTN